MTLEQVVLTMINDKMLDNGQISEKMHSSIQKDIFSLVASNTASMKREEQANSSYHTMNESVKRIK